MRGNTDGTNMSGWKVGAYEPSTGIHGDIEYLYEIDLKAKALKGWHHDGERKGASVTRELLAEVMKAEKATASPLPWKGLTNMAVSTWTMDKMITPKRVEIVASLLFPDDVHTGDCRNEHGKIGEPCAICASLNTAWTDRQEQVRQAMFRAFA